MLDKIDDSNLRKLETFNKSFDWFVINMMDIRILPVIVGMMAAGTESRPIRAKLWLLCDQKLFQSVPKDHVIFHFAHVINCCKIRTSGEYVSFYHTIHVFIESLP